MPTTRLSFAIAAIFACSAFAQTGKVIYLTHVETPQDLQEVVNVVRSIAEIRDVTPDPTKMSITVHGTADQNALAQWLCGEIDRAAPQPAGTQQYTVPNSDVPAVQVFFLAQMNTPQFLQEAVNAVRSVADIQRFFPYNRLHAVIARGSIEQAAVASNHDTYDGRCHVDMGEKGIALESANDLPEIVILDARPIVGVSRIDEGRGRRSRRRFGLW